MGSLGLPLRGAAAVVDGEAMRVSPCQSRAALRYETNCPVRALGAIYGVHQSWTKRPKSALSEDEASARGISARFRALS